MTVEPRDYTLAKSPDSVEFTLLTTALNNLWQWLSGFSSREREGGRDAQGTYGELITINVQGASTLSGRRVRSNIISIYTDSRRPITDCGLEGGTTVDRTAESVRAPAYTERTQDLCVEKTTVGRSCRGVSRAYRWTSSGNRCIVWSGPSKSPHAEQATAAAMATANDGDGCDDIGPPKSKRKNQKINRAIFGDATTWVLVYGGG